MSRAALMASEGDPFTTLFCIKLWQERWKDEIDAFYININNESIPSYAATEMFERLFAISNVHVIYHPNRIGNGQALTELLRVCTQEEVLLIENDGYIFTPGAVDRCFSLIEGGSCDAVGSERRSCGQELYDAAIKRFNIDVSGYGDVGPNYWPNFFFCRKKDLLATDLNFDSVRFDKGSYSSELDHTFLEDNYGDTFVWTSIQLHAQGIRFAHVSQHKASPTEFLDKTNSQGNWHPSQQPFEWIHAGSLSSGWGGYLSDKELPELTDGQKLEFENRCAWWDLASDEIEGFSKFRGFYKDGIHKLIMRAGLSRDTITKRKQLYKQIMNI